MDQFIDPEPANDDAGAGFGIVPRYLRGQLTAYEIAVYVALSWRVDSTGMCWLRHKRLADEAGCSLNTARRALDSLKEKGLVDWRPRYADDGALLCNEYQLTTFRATPPPSQGAPPALSGSTPRPHRATEREPLNETPGTTLDIPLPPAPEQRDTFAAWYDRYPRKVGRAAAEKAYRRALKTATPEQLLAGLELYLGEIEAKRTARDYIKHPATWLNGGCWADEHDTGPAQIVDRRQQETDAQFDRMLARAMERDQQRALGL